jgi:hypothetical protein
VTLEHLAVISFALAACNKTNETPPLASPVELGTAPLPFGLVAGIRLGVTADEVKEAAPALHSDPEGKVFRGRSGRETYEVWLARGHVQRITMQLGGRSLDDARAAWGSGWSCYPQDWIRYSVDTDRMQITVLKTLSGDGITVIFEPLVSVANIFDADPRWLLAVKVLGRPMATVVQDFEAKGFDVERNGQTWKIHRLPIEGSKPSVTGASIFFHPAGSVTLVNRWSVWMQCCACDEVREEILSLYDELWGEPTEDDEKLIYATEPPVMVDSTDLSVHVELR